MSDDELPELPDEPPAFLLDCPVPPPAPALPQLPPGRLTPALSSVMVGGSAYLDARSVLACIRWYAREWAALAERSRARGDEADLTHAAHGAAIAVGWAADLLETEAIGARSNWQ